MSNRDNVRLFRLDLSKFARKVDTNVRIAIQLVSLEVFRKLTLRTPVDTGRARASWDLKVGEASDYVPPEGDYSAPRDIGGAAAEIDGKKIVFITSSLDYMQYLDEGSSQQAPAGMVDITLAEVEIEFENIIRQLAA